MAGLSRPILRFAPSPNGRLHLGHALSALGNEDWTRRLGGRLLLRIEDIDTARCKPEFVAGVQDDLAWLGLSFDGEVRRQSEHFAVYAAALAQLRTLGVAYPCFCSRADIQKAVLRAEAAGRRPLRDPEGAPVYPRICNCRPANQVASRLGSGDGHVLRLDMVRAFGMLNEMPSYRRFDETGESLVACQPLRWGDVVLARRDVPTSYHLAVVVDDALQGVTHVVRGRDLEAATDIHVVLQALLGLPTPRYHFHRLLNDDSGQKLAKSRGSRSLADWRARGASPAEIRRMLGF